MSGCYVICLSLGQSLDRNWALSSRLLRVPGRSYFFAPYRLRTGQGSWAKLLSQPWRWRGRAGRAGEAGPDDARPEPRSARAVSDACLCICRQVGSCCDEGFVCAQTELLTPAQERVVTLLHMVLRFVAEDTFNLCLLAGKVLPSLAVSGADAAPGMDT